MATKIELGTIIEDFSNSGVWPVTGSTGVLGTNTVQHKEGNSSVSLQSTNTSAYIRRDHGELIDMSAGDVIFIRFYVHGEAGLTPGGVTTMRIAFIEDSGITKYFQVIFLSSGSLGEGHYCIAIKKPTVASSRWDIAGAADWSKIRYVQIFMDPAGTYTTKISWLGIRMGYSATPWVVLTFDDGFISDYTIAAPLIESYGWHMTSYVPTANIGGGGMLTKANCDTLYNAGHDISNHSATHSVSGLIILTQPELAAEVDTPYNTYIDYGYTRSAKHFAYPYGNSNSTVVDALKINHVTGRRFHTPDMFTHPDLLTDGQYLIPGKDIAEANWVTRSGEIIEAVEAGRPYVCVWHSITNQTNFALMLSGIASLQVTYPNLRVGSMSEYYDWLTGMPEQQDVRKNTLYNIDCVSSGSYNTEYSSIWN